MQEEIEHKTVNFAISTTKLSARTLLRGMQFLLRQYDKHASQGRQSMKRLVRQNRGVTNVEIQKTGIRSREISACLVLQTRSQLKAIYKDNADTIVGNMDSQIFLGGSEPTTLKELSEALGKETIDGFNTSDTRGNSPSYGTNYQKLGHELMSRDELAMLDGGKCILQLRGVRPFLSDKYDLTQHPNYKYTSDYDPKNALDIEKFLNQKEKIHPDDTFIMVDADSLPPA